MRLRISNKIGPVFQRLRGMYRERRMVSLPVGGFNGTLLGSCTSWRVPSNKRSVSPLAISSVVTFFFLLAVSGIAYAQDQASGRSIDSSDSSKQPASEKLDSLDEQLLEGIDDNASPAEAAAPTESEQPDQSSGVESPNVLESPARGSDIFRHNPLARIGQDMRRVEELLGRRKVSRETQQTQQQIVEQLDELIATLATSQQSQQQQKQHHKSESTRPGDQQAARSGKEPASNGSGKPEAADSAPRQPAALPAAMNETWGHLPERLRRQIRSAEAVEFLPKYRRLIEDYFSRLAEER